MLENIVVGVIIVGFLALTVWGIRIDREQAALDVKTARAQAQARSVRSKSNIRQ